METITCPYCQTENPITRKKCSSCGKILRGGTAEPEFTGLKIPFRTEMPEPQTPAAKQQNPAAAPQPKAPGSGGVQPVPAAGSATDKSTETDELPSLPETPADGEPETRGPSDGRTRPEEFVRRCYSYPSPVEAAGAYAEAFLAAQTNGQRVMLRGSARKKIICAVILAVVLFLEMSLRMMYHRNKIIYLLIAAACVYCAVRFVYKNNNAAALGKKLASMPDADMESVLMSEIDQTVPVRKVRMICSGIMAAAFAAVLIVFLTPHMIFEKTDGVVSLRFYTDSVIKEKNVVIPDTWNGEPVTQIRGNVFEGISWIETVRLPAQLEVIRAHAFQNCSQLREVVFPGTLREIGSSAFRNCRSLISVTLPLQCSVNIKAFKDSPTDIHRFTGE